MVRKRETAIKRACWLFSISQTCYRYQPKLSDENAWIGDGLLRLAYTAPGDLDCVFCGCATSKASTITTSIYQELESNLRIKPKRRIKREKPEALAAPQQINEVWSAFAMLSSQRVCAKSFTERHGK